MHHRMAGSFKRRNLRILTRVGRALQPHVRKHAIVAVNRRRANLLAIHRRNSLPLFAGRLGDQLLQPRAQVVNLRRSEDRDLVAPRVVPRFPAAGQVARLVVRDRLLAAATRLGRLIQQLVDLQPHRRRRHHAKIRQRRVAPANLRIAIKNMAEVVGLRHLLHL